MDVVACAFVFGTGAKLFLGIPIGFVLGLVHLPIFVALIHLCIVGVSALI